MPDVRATINEALILGDGAHLRRRHWKADGFIESAVWHSDLRGFARHATGTVQQEPRDAQVRTANAIRPAQAI
jgi:hypothetical protein